ncbi:hypothetical protein Hypma_015080 [Hypsizygus marmoreus]|uniref:Uncharacterized protein n=1 Tax=Hypsizygus marmoreus TaxID=39966 RepID=A0A369K6S5_HYPMA|nr:hypothetical protein Hypma_015080 [Hypsizygus marmoreus]
MSSHHAITSRSSATSPHASPGPASGPTRSRPIRSQRYSPYPNPRHSLRRLNITHLDQAYLEQLVDSVRPRSPRRILAAALAPPAPEPQIHRTEENVEDERGGIIFRIMEWIFKFLEDIIIGPI